MRNSRSKANAQNAFVAGRARQFNFEYGVEVTRIQDTSSTMPFLRTEQNSIGIMAVMRRAARYRDIARGSRFELPPPHAAFPRKAQTDEEKIRHIDLLVGADPEDSDFQQLIGELRSVVRRGTQAGLVWVPRL